MAVLNLLLLLSALSQSWAAPAPVTPRATCYSGVYMIVARASGELPGEGLIQPVADGIQARIPDSASVAVAYPATLVAYKASLSGGVADMTKKIKAYVDACGAASDIVLLGYSQGAQVVSSTLAGSSGMPLLGLPLLASGGISTDYSKYSASQSASTSGPGMLTNPRSVSGAILMGDVSFTAGQPFDAGNSTQSGVSQFIQSVAIKNLRSNLRPSRSWLAPAHR